MTSRFAVLLPMLLLAGCGGGYAPDTYNATAMQQANKVERGFIVGVRPVKVSADGTVATATGAAAGGIAGAETPWGTVTRAFTALGGAVIGGVAGAGVGHVLSDTNAWEYIIREPNGDLVSVTQRDKVPLEAGLSVLVITGKQARVVADYTIPVSPPAPPAAKAVAGKKPPASPASPAPAPASSGPAPSGPAAGGSATGAESI